MKLQDLAERLGCRLEGDGALEVHRVASLEHAGPGDVTFFANPKYASALRRTRASAVILGDLAPAASCAMLRTKDPYLAFANAVGVFVAAPQPAPGVDEMTHVAPDATLGREVSIGPFVSIGRGARIGDRTVIYPNVSIGDGAAIGEDCIVHSQVAIRERTIIGNRVVLQNGAVIGGDGFGFVRRPDGTHQKIPQTSIVVIEDDVEIGANTTVDRPAVGETRIQAGTKIDNLVQVGHGVTVGKNVLLAAQVGIAGSTSIGDGAMLGGQVGVAGHVKIGKNVVAVGQSGITNSVPDGAFLSGYPAIENREWLKSSVIFRRLPALRKKIADLEQRVLEIEALLEESRLRSK
ncbi:MAG TPA: UDP-3-O-(3-hydroxymyristoyl)glucosamine N-acyltransferase [Vicinamibacterales bacterium]|jgi:UDP-3-O-[3-hydroxymyristoyl] glucosamine N-acyltransferase|nr:UDP-3-O-(3-hydroxymyristoyl)glucosamine N-acyltransferase [Vicinamibacterales bacterium]